MVVRTSPYMKLKSKKINKNNKKSQILFDLNFLYKNETKTPNFI